MKIERVLAATDFSVAGNNAVGEAALWALRSSAALRVVHVLPPKRWLRSHWNAGNSILRAIEQNAAAALRRVADESDPSGKLELSTALLTGAASAGISRAAQTFSCDLLVIGAHGVRGAHGSGAGGLGGTASKLVRTSRSPLLLVRKPPSGEAPSVVVAAVDLTQVSPAVLTWARLVGAAHLHVLHSYEVPFADRLAAYGVSQASIDVYSAEEHARRVRALEDLVGANPGGPAECTVVRGDPFRSILRSVAQLDAGLVVLGQCSHHPWRRARTSFGSVCRYVTAFAPTNVLVVPPS